MYRQVFWPHGVFCKEERKVILHMAHVDEEIVGQVLGKNFEKESLLSIIIRLDKLSDFF